MTSAAQRSALLGVVVVLALASGGTVDATQPFWSSAGTSAVGRHGHALTALDDGRILATGGSSTSSRFDALNVAEIYDPSSGTWWPAAEMPAARMGHAAAVLGDGRVLTSGGDSAAGLLSSANLYDPSSDSWSSVAPMHHPRRGHSSTRLLDGRVLILGGSDSGLTFEVYDPSSNSWSPPALHGAGSFWEGHTTGLLPDGRVLAYGEANGSLSPHIFDPASSSWTVGAAMSPARKEHAAALLPDGRVLIAGGGAGSQTLSDINVYDPSSDSWSPAGSMSVARFGHRAAQLSNGAIMFFGGYGANYAPLATAELYHPTSAVVSPVPPMVEPRTYATVARVSGCAGLVVGGAQALPAPTTAERFDVIPPSEIDVDGDCLPDDYEALHSCLTVGVNDAGDYEGDGLLHISEFVFDGNPCADDGDGCDDLQERGLNPAMGGKRDPFSPWDFFDVPAPAGPATGADGKLVLTPASVRNGAVTLQDVGVVLAYVGRASNNPAYTQDNNLDGIVDGLQLDRSPSAVPGEPWRSGPPSGAVSLADVGVALAQVGHSCAIADP